MKDNKIIAEFMGVEKENGLYLFTTPMDDYKTDTLCFDVSWDWLMPVVEKCLEKHNNLIDGRDIVVTPYAQIVEGLKVASLKETYNAVVEFIKSLHFYNQLK